LFWRRSSDLSSLAERQDGYLTLQLFEVMVGTQTHNFCSKETDPTCCPASAEQQPYLTITTAVVPLPPSVWLLGFALAGMLMASKRRMAVS